MKNSYESILEEQNRLKLTKTPMLKIPVLCKSLLKLGACP
jgi:hypothetical protein